jgi:hypothetical protein
MPNPDNNSNHSDNTTIKLTLPELKNLNALIKSEWFRFIHNAPPDWNNDKWLTSRIPLGLICLYGQNQPISTSGPNILSDQSRWHNSRDYSLARWLTYAAATHYESVLNLIPSQ